MAALIQSPTTRRRLKYLQMLTYSPLLKIKTATAAFLLKLTFSNCRIPIGKLKLRPPPNQCIQPREIRASLTASAEACAGGPVTGLDTRDRILTLSLILEKFKK